MVNRKLFRPTLTDVKEQQFVPRPSAPAAPQQQSAPQRKKPAPPEQTHAENFYFVKQMQSRTPVAVVLTDGEVLHGSVEWYDRDCIKLTRIGSPNVLLYKRVIKYIEWGVQRREWTRVQWQWRQRAARRRIVVLLRAKHLPFARRFGERAYEKSHQRFGDQALGVVGDVTVDHGEMSPDADHFRIGGYGSAFHPFQVIDLHFDRSHARAQRAGHIAGQAAGGIG